MKEEDDVLLSRYLAEELNDKELQDFTARLSRDTALQSALARRQQERNFLRAEASRAALQEKMAALAGEHFTAANERVDEKADGKEQTAVTTAKIRPLRQQKWWMVAGAAAAVALILLLWNPFAGEDPYRQFASYEPLYLSEKSTDVVAGAQPAEAAFNEGDYATAYVQLANYLRERPEDNEARLALGIAALETGRSPEAITIFSDLAAGTTAFQNDGRYYLALALLKAGDYPAARAAISAIPATDPDFGGRRQAVLDWLDDH